LNERPDSPDNRIAELESEISRLQKSLRKAELNALQFQINPHFIFNTLNAVQQIAMMEGAEKTSEFLDNFSKLLRYNLKKIDQTSTIKEELENVRSYIYLLKARYGDWIQVLFDIDQDVNNIEMPALVFQPLIENACVHGIGDSRSGVGITLRISNDTDTVRVVIEDNGAGMSSELIREALSISSTNGSLHEEDGHATGIGLKNVIRRLRLFYRASDIVNIESSVGNGTRVILSLPAISLVER